MKQKLTNFFQRPFIRNVIILSTGTAGAQIVTMLFSPVITRLYGPEAYGLMGTFMAIVYIISPIAALTYPIAIVLPKHNNDAKGLVKLSIIIATILSAITCLILFTFYKFIVDLFQLQEIGPYLYLLPLVILSAGFLQVIEQWLIRTKQFTVSAKVAFIHSLIINGGKAGIGLFYPFAKILVILSAFTQGLKAFLLFVFSKKYRANIDLVTNSKETFSLKKLAKRYNDFPLFRAPEVLLNAVSGNLPVLILTVFFGPAAAGFYSIGRSVLNIPSQLIGKSVGDVFYPRISEAANNGENLTKLIKSATLALGGVGFLPYGIIFAFGPWLFSFVFGQEWGVAGEYARWIALWSFFGFINRPSVMALPVLSAQKFHLFFTIIMLITRILALGIGFYVFSSDTIAVALFGVSGAILNIGLILITIRISKRYDLQHENRFNVQGDN